MMDKRGPRPRPGESRQTDPPTAWPDFGYIDNRKRKKLDKAKSRAADVLTGVAIGFLIGIFAALIFISQLGQFVDR